MRIAGVLLSIVFMAGLFVAPASSNSVHPNPDANALCPFGPGKARWDVKTSLAPGSDPSQTQTVNVADLVNAPDLAATAQTVALAQAQVMRVRSMMRNQGATLLTHSEQTVAPLFTAQLKWIARSGAVHSQSRPTLSATAAHAVGPSFALKLPAITPAIVHRVDAINQDPNPDEAPPSFFDAVLSAQLEDTRLPDPITMGGNEFHEGDLISVSGYVLKSSCEKDDGDFHIDLAASAGADTCAIVEVPNPSYIESLPLRSLIAKAESTAKALSPGDHITVYGQFFYDATHSSASDPGGGRGEGHCAQSLWEVHPIVRIKVD